MKKIVILTGIFLPLIAVAADLPRFSYWDIGLFSATVVENYDFHSELYYSLFTGRTLFQLGIMGGYGPLKYVALEGGVGFVLPWSKHLKDRKTSRVLDVQRTPTYYGEEVTYTYERLKTDVARLSLLEAGVITVLWSELNVQMGGDNLVAYGQTYPAVSEADFHANDVLLFLGYKGMWVPRLNLTTSEFMWWVRGLAGFTRRNADIWDNSFNTDPAWTPRKDPGISFGAEIGLKYYITQLRVGFYERYPYFSVGFRIPFTTGFRSPVKSSRY